MPRGEDTCAARISQRQTARSPTRHVDADARCRATVPGKKGTSSWPAPPFAQFNAGGPSGNHLSWCCFDVIGYNYSSYHHFVPHGATVTNGVWRCGHRRVKHLHIAIFFRRRHRHQRGLAVRPAIPPSVRSRRTAGLALRRPVCPTANPGLARGLAAPGANGKRPYGAGPRNVGVLTFVARNLPQPQRRRHASEDRSMAPSVCVFKSCHRSDQEIGVPGERPHFVRLESCHSHSGSRRKAKLRRRPIPRACSSNGLVHTDAKTQRLADSRRPGLPSNARGRAKRRNSRLD